MMKDLFPDDSRGLVMAALVYLHRELDRVAELRLTPADITAYENRPDGKQVAFDYDEATGDIVLRHQLPRSDA